MSTAFSCFSVLVVVLALAACSSSDGASDGSRPTALSGTADDATHCSKYCDGLATKCPAAFEELKGRDCNAQCSTSVSDTSADMRRCLASAASCDAMATCKKTH